MISGVFAYVPGTYCRPVEKPTAPSAIALPDQRPHLRELRRSSAGGSSVPMTALRTVLWPISVAKLTARRCRLMRGERLADVERRAAAVAGDDRRHAHADEVLGERLLREIVRVRVHVDEAGRDDQPRGVDHLARVLRARWCRSRRSVLDGSRRRRAAPARPIRRCTRAADDDEVVARGGWRAAAPVASSSARSPSAATIESSCGLWHAASPVDQAHQQADDHHDDDADRIVPEKRDAAGRGVKRERRDDRHAGQQADERAVPVARLNAERQDEDAEQRPVEERPEPVDDLDQRPEAGGVDRDDAGDEAPEARRSFETDR